MLIHGLDVGGAPLYLVDVEGHSRIPLLEIDSLGLSIANMRQCLMDSLYFRVLSLFGGAKFGTVMRSSEGVCTGRGSMRCSDMGP